MVDIVDIKTRSRMMAGIRGKDTKPEILIRHGLHARGYRYRLHDKKLPGKPDLVMPKYSAVIFVNGCFWHGHDCHLFRIPKSNTDFWKNKISRNKELDGLHTAQLISMGWRVAIIGECALKGKAKLNFEELLDSIETWIHSGSVFITQYGNLEKIY
jgi:DNA mismatch endonuclease (patch repair protein)